MTRKKYMNALSFNELFSDRHIESYDKLAHRQTDAVALWGSPEVGGTLLLRGGPWAPPHTRGCKEALRRLFPQKLETHTREGGLLSYRRV